MKYLVVFAAFGMALGGKVPQKDLYESSFIGGKYFLYQYSIISVKFQIS